MVIKKLNRSELAKKIHASRDECCMLTNFGGRDLSGFGDIATLKNGQIFIWGTDYSAWSSKNLIDWNWLKKFMQIL